VTPISAPTDVNSASEPPPVNRTLAANAATLFLGQGIGLIVPLVTIPYLARVLGPSAWGPIIAAQSLGAWLFIVLEFGFELSGTRAIARARSAPHTIPDVVHGVQSAKILLSLASLPLVAIGIVVIPAARANVSLVLWAVAFAVLRGLSPLWFFQGIERVRGAVAVDTASRTAAALCVFLFVHGPLDGWRVLALQAVFAALALAVLTGVLTQHAPPRTPRLGVALETLRSGWTIFASRAWTGLYIQGNADILSAFAGPAVVAFFGGAERIIRAAINLLQPLTQVFLPRVTYLHAVDPPAAQRMIRRALIGVGLFGAFMGACGFLGAPLLVRVILGAGYEPAIPVLRLMSLLPMLISVNGVLSLYWGLPFGHERWLLASIIAAGVTNVALAVVLVPRWGASGMALSAIIAEVVALGIMIAVYLRNQH
jgi:PST family polysaccharide transporter